MAKFQLKGRGNSPALLAIRGKPKANYMEINVTQLLHRQVSQTCGPRVNLTLGSPCERAPGNDAPSSGRRDAMGGLLSRARPAVEHRAVPHEKTEIMMASRAWKVIQPHVPMIKFRKGGIDRAVAGAMAAPSARPGPARVQQSAGGATGPRVVVLPTIEDLYLPPRYQRRPIDQKEIEYINRGGPE